MNASSTTETDNAKKGTRRKVLVFDDEDFAIDESDYRVISELMLASGILDDEVERQSQQIVGIRENDEERRVYTLSMHPDMNVLSLPPSIGRLHNLKELCLHNTNKLLELPEEIGDLTSLITLNLQHSGITSLPPSIGRLQNLEELNLCDTNNLLRLPEEIGDLASLNRLLLRRSGITSLPPSIGRLQNLKDLSVSQTENLLQLPEEIGDLASLITLSISGSGITSLPPSIGRLQNLEDLNLRYTENLLELPEEIGDLASLSSLRLHSRHQEKKLFFALACSGARSKIIRTKPKLWPRMLYYATRPFRQFYRDPGTDYIVEKPDAIYQLLVDGRESFIGLLFNRSTTKETKNI